MSATGGALGYDGLGRRTRARDSCPTIADNISRLCRCQCRSGLAVMESWDGVVGRGTGQ